MTKRAVWGRKPLWVAPWMITCESVLTEATYLTRKTCSAHVALWEMLGEGFLTIGLSMADQHAALLALVRR
ncbi:MAG: hypothetical protein JZU60_00130 [Ilumatobacteraceae bacterium]|jgi:hypothetical protein|nr:hypothetical protein [Ilumatobacteraceae bacterium]